jgi:hypothetical protein
MYTQGQILCINVHFFYTVGIDCCYEDSALDCTVSRCILQHSPVMTSEVSSHVMFWNILYSHFTRASEGTQAIQSIRDNAVGKTCAKCAE